MMLGVSSFRLSAGLAALGAALLLAGCSAAPPPPLMSPIASTKYFGFTDKPLDGDRFEVTYVAPPRQTSRLGTVEKQDADTARTVAFDLATWRAAQVALAHGFEGFRLDDRRTDFTTYVDPHITEPYTLDRYLRFRERWGTDYPAPPFAATPAIRLQARAIVDVTLVHAPGTSDFNAAETVQRLEQQYSKSMLAEG